MIAIPVPQIRVPSDDLETGDRLMLYRTPGGGSGETEASEVIGEGRVFSVDQSDDAGSDIRISVTIDESLAPEITSAVAQDQIYVGQAAAG